VSLQFLGRRNMSLCILCIAFSFPKRYLCSPLLF
jgi:hypothetical protein